MGKPEPWIIWALGAMAAGMLALLIIGIARDDGEAMARTGLALFVLLSLVAAAVWSMTH